MSAWVWFIVGLIAGVALTGPFIYLATRRTERRVRRLEQRARSAERLAELGTMTGGLAHEIKNPLSTIGLNLQLLRETVDDAKLDELHAGRLQRRIDALSGEVEHLRAILEDFLQFAGRIELDRQPVDLNDLVHQLVDFYAPQAEQSGVQVRTELADALPTLHADPQLLKQAMLNLLMNATQAMVQARYGEQPHGGSTDLIVRTRRAGETVELHVIDTGPGIDEATMRKIFQPYFSTKRGGTGLGLPTTRRIVEEHGGELQVYSDSGQGTDFVVRLAIGEPADQTE
jgi:signal transduction histidine kinase